MAERGARATAQKIYNRPFRRRSGPAPEWWAVFLEALRDLGFVEGINVVFERRYAEDRLDRLPELAAELVRLNVNVIGSGGESQK
jgi:hypothetical protein